MTTTAKTVFVKTYGCQMNVYDSQRMQDVLAPLGYTQTDKADNADLVILNTCHIREKAVEKVYSELGRYRDLKTSQEKKGVDMLIAVAGCVGQAAARSGYASGRAQGNRPRHHAHRAHVVARSCMVDRSIDPGDCACEQRHRGWWASLSCVASWWLCDSAIGLAPDYPFG